MPDLPGETLALGQVDEGLGIATIAAKGGKGMVLCLILIFCDSLSPLGRSHAGQKPPHAVLKKSLCSAQGA